MIILIFGNMILLQIHGHKKQTLEVTEEKEQLDFP